MIVLSVYFGVNGYGMEMKFEFFDGMVGMGMNVGGLVEFVVSIVMMARSRNTFSIRASDFVFVSEICIVVFLDVFFVLCK